MSGSAALALLADLAARGFELAVEDGSLRARPKGALDEALRLRVAALRAELIAELETRPDSFTGMVCDLFDGKVVDDTSWETALLPANAGERMVLPSCGASTDTLPDACVGKLKAKPAQHAPGLFDAPDRHPVEGRK